MSALSHRRTFFDLFPTPEYLLLSTTGIAISEEDISFIQFKRRFLTAKMKLAHDGRVVLPPGSASIEDPRGLLPALKELSSAHSLSYVRANLPEEKAYLFTTLIDKVPAEGLRDAVAFIIEENVPVTLAESVFDFEVVKDTGSQLKVAVTVLPKKTVEAYSTALRDAGLIPISFDTDSQAVARAVIERGDKRAQLILNLGERKTGLYAIEGEVAQFSTALPYGRVSGDRAKVVSDLKNEIRKLTAFWSTNAKAGPALPISRAVVSGKGALDEAFVKEVMSESGMEYAIANPWVNTGCFRELSPNALKEGLEYAAAIGLALPKSHHV